mmetsp:Transcript_23216/g.66527  ORF Transcript_23216/g.66527 Transcript_23216/m.66527 type:complete len:231 (+) Transcript_23216:633-1325(+)
MKCHDCLPACLQTDRQTDRSIHDSLCAPYSQEGKKAAASVCLCGVGSGGRDGQLICAVRLWKWGFSCGEVAHLVGQPKGIVIHIPVVGHEEHVQTLLDVVGQLVVVLLVVQREQQYPGVFSPCSDDFLLDAADPQHPPRQRQLPRHGQIPHNRLVDGQGHECRRHGDARRRAVLWRGALGHVQVDRRLVQEAVLGVDGLDEVAGEGEGDLGALAHDAAQLAGHLEGTAHR